MTKLPTDDGGGASTSSERRKVCRWCRRPVEQPATGRPRQFCKRSCRQRDFEARAAAASHGLDEHDLIIARTELDALKDQLYVLQCAVDDVDRDLADGPDAAEVRAALDWLMEAARPLGATLMFR